MADETPTKPDIEKPLATPAPPVKSRIIDCTNDVEEGSAFQMFFSGGKPTPPEA